MHGDVNVKNTCLAFRLMSNIMYRLVYKTPQNAIESFHKNRTETEWNGKLLLYFCTLSMFTHPCGSAFTYYTRAILSCIFVLYFIYYVYIHP